MYKYNEKHLFQLIQLGSIDKIYDDLPYEKQLLVDKIIDQLKDLYNVLFHAIRGILAIYNTKRDILTSDINNDLKLLIFNLKEYNNIKDEDIKMILDEYIKGLRYSKFKELIKRYYVDRNKRQNLTFS